MLILNCTPTRLNPLNSGLTFRAPSAQHWSEPWISKGYCANLVLLKLFPIIVALEIWGDRRKEKHIHCLSDNMGVVQAVKQPDSQFPSCG